MTPRAPLAAAQRLALLALPLLMAACAAPVPLAANWYLVSRDGDSEDQASLAKGVHVALLNRSQQTLQLRAVRINPLADAPADEPGWRLFAEDQDRDKALTLAPGQMLVGRPSRWPAEQPPKPWPECTLPVQVEITLEAPEPGGLQRLLQGFSPANRWMLRIDPALPNAMPAAWASCPTKPLSSPAVPGAVPRP